MTYTAIIMAPDLSCELGVVYENGQLYAGFISNSGVNKQWIIDYDEDFTFEENLQCLGEKIYEEWE